VGFFGTSGRKNNKQNKNIQQIGNGEHPFMPNEPSLKARQLSAAAKILVNGIVPAGVILNR
jgi:hypothetical protein